MSDVIFTNCGAYLPGQRPITISRRISGSPNKIVPGGPVEPTEPDPPIIGQVPTFKCATIEVIPCPQPNENFIEEIRKDCLPCDGNFNITYGIYNPNVGDEGCDYLELAECYRDAECISEVFLCPSAPTDKWKCTDRPLTTNCPPPQDDVIEFSGTRFRCKPCNGNLGSDGTFNPTPDEEGCVYNSREECQNEQCERDELVQINQCIDIPPPQWYCKELNQLDCREVYPSWYTGVIIERECTKTSTPPPGVTLYRTESDCLAECRDEDTCRPEGFPPKYKCNPVEIPCDQLSEYGPGYVGTVLLPNCTACTPTVVNGVATYDPGCDYNTLQECVDSCPGYVNCDQSETGESSVPAKYICKDTGPIECQPPLIGANGVTRECKLCSVRLEPVPGSGIVSVEYLDPDTGLVPDPEGPQCVELETCQQSCSNEVPNCIEPNSTGIGQVIFNRVPDSPNPTNGVGVFNPGLRPGNQYLNVTLNIDNSISVNVSQLAQRQLSILEDKKPNLIKVEGSFKESIPVAKENFNKQANIYDLKKNFFKPLKYYVDNEKVNLVANSYYREIFSDYIAEEIHYVIGLSNTSQPWKETKLQLITLDKIAVSLNPYVLRIFNNLHDITNQKIPVNYFLETIKKHLLTGTLNEFDIQYFKEIYEIQKQDEIKEYIKSDSKELLERAALKIIKENQITLSIEDKPEYNLKQLQRFKKLNTDISSRICLSRLDGCDDNIFIPDAGMSLEVIPNIAVPSATQSTYLDNGIGGGYYFPLQAVVGDCVSFEYDTEVSASVYTPPETRYEALRLINEDPDFYITASSLDGYHELSSSFVHNVPLEAMYFAIDLSSVRSTPTSNKLVDRYEADFKLLTDQQQINDHTDTHGFSVVKATIDYRDPIFKYIYDTSTLSFYQNDINFRQQSLNKTINDNLIITRNIPFGLIVTPVVGSKENPYNQESKITSFSNSKIVREIKMAPSFEDSFKDKFKTSELAEITLFDATNSFRVGVSEPVDDQGITYRFSKTDSAFSKTFYNTELKEYSTSSSAPEIQPRGVSYMVTEVIDYLISTYNPSEISWYEVLRRMPINKFGEIFYTYNKNLIQSLIDGYRGEVKINNVLNRINSDEAIQDLPDDEKVVITLKDR